MEYCSACKSILKPEYTFSPFCGAKIPGKPEAEDTGEILLLAKPEPGDVVVYKSWETIEDDKAVKTLPERTAVPILKPGSQIQNTSRIKKRRAMEKADGLPMMI